MAICFCFTEFYVTHKTVINLNKKTTLSYKVVLKIKVLKDKNLVFESLKCH